jgi:hypothetical protein
MWGKHSRLGFGVVDEEIESDSVAGLYDGERSSDGRFWSDMKNNGSECGTVSVLPPDRFSGLNLAAQFGRGSGRRLVKGT